jgi:aerobic-type carbon monoxide dehydrogenase small subunit (CoxS/CutS family)
MTDDVTILVNGVPRRVSASATVAAALLGLGITAFRRDQHGAPRAPICGMGSCHECRVTIDGTAEVRSCLVGVRDGMRVETAT